MRNISVKTVFKFSVSENMYFKLFLNRLPLIGRIFQTKNGWGRVNISLCFEFPTPILECQWRSALFSRNWLLCLSVREPDKSISGSDFKLKGLKDRLLNSLIILIHGKLYPLGITQPCCSCVSNIDTVCGQNYNVPYSNDNECTTGLDVERTSLRISI